MGRVAWVLLMALLLGVAPLPAEELPVRIGLLSFQDDEDPLARLRRRAAEIRRASPELRPSFAIGTYGELWHWILTEQIEVAAINPGLFARLDKERWQYLGSALTRGEDDYRSVWLTRKNSGLKTLEDLKAAGVDLNVIAVHPLSVSGFINPVAALDMPLAAEQLRFSHSHTNSLRYLAAAEGPWVAAVWAVTWRDNPDPDLVEIEVPGLAKYRNPPMVLVGRRDSQGAQQVRKLVQRGKFSGYTFDPDYLNLIEALPAAPEGRFERPLDRVDLDDLMLTLHHYNQTHPEPARLGLVLTGGGAKCSYQAGAVRALEESLEKARQRYADPNLDIELVVGTSGGAINAISVALGLTRTPEGYADVRSAWLDLDQKEIVCPPPAVRWNLWFWFASIAGLLLLALVQLFKLPKAAGLTLTALFGALMMFLPQVGLKTGDSTAQHFWAWVSWGVEGAGLILLGSALGGGLTWWVRQRQGLAFSPATWVLRLCILGVAILPLLQTYTMFFQEEYVSENRGLESALIRNFGRLIDNQIKRSGGRPEAGKSVDLAALSRRVFEQRMLQRDLVLTASPLTDPEMKLPAEYYFFAPAHSRESPAQPEFGQGGVALLQRPEVLFDAMLGSAAIYPLFPARRLQGLPGPGQHVDLVDGSFAHRNPLEGAVKWKATHVLVIEASTTEVVARGALLDNFGAALTFLYDQAQLVDVRLKGRTALYTLYPSAPHIGLLDFATPLIEGSLDKGYREAGGTLSRATEEGGSWHKELGPPSFWRPQ